jgi:hypothetical protein
VRIFLLCCLSPFLRWLDCCCSHPSCGPSCGSLPVSSALLA